MAKDDILLKLELEESKVKLRIKNLKKDLKDLDGRTLEYKNKVKQLEAAEASLASTRGRLSTRNQELSKSYGNLNKNLDGSTKSTGAASSAALELGRIVSDMPYGIRGVANNLSQFASTVTFMATTTDKATGKVVGLAGAMKYLWASLKGPLGILLAIQAVIAAIDYFSNSTSKAEKATASLSEKAITPAVSELMLLKDVLEDTNISLEDKQDALRGAAKEHKELNDVVLTGSKDMALAVDVIDKLITKYMDFAKAKAMMELFNEEVKTQQKLLAEGAGFGNLFDSFEAFFTGFIATLPNNLRTGVSPIAAAFNVAVGQSAEAIKKYEELLKSPSEADPSKSYYELIFGSKKGDKDKKPKTLPTAKEFEQELLNLSKVQEKYRRQNLLADAKTEEEKKALKIQFEMQDIASSFNTFKAKRDRDLREYEKGIQEKIRKDSRFAKEGNRLIADARKKRNDEDVKAYEEYLKTLQGVAEKYAQPIADEISLVGDNYFGGGAEALAQRNKKIFEAGLSSFKMMYSGITDFMTSEFDRQMTIEQNKTNKMNQELNDRLLNEQMSKEQRQAIQQQIWQNDENLRKRQEKIAKKKFKTQKAFNIAAATVDAYLAGSQVLADPILKGQPWIRIPMAIATISSGLLNVASIARQRFQSTSAATPLRAGALGGLGRSSSDRSFNFNLAGNSQENQVLQAIQSQFDEPIQAYVTQNDISNSQQLEAEILGAASF